MAEEFSIYAKILADTKDFQKNINAAVQSLEKFNSKTIDAQKKGASVGTSLKATTKQLKLSKSETQAFTKILSSAGGAAGSFGSSIMSMASSCGPYVAAIVAAIAVTKKYIQSIFDCAEAFHVQERAEKGLEIAAKNSEVITSTQVKLLKEYAGDLQKLTDIGDEQSIQLMTQLVASGRTFDEVKKIMSASVDYAKGTNTDIATAVKTLNATYAGLSGTLGKQLKDVRNLTEEELKQGKAIEIVAEKYKGLGEQLVSVKEQAKNASGDLKEAWGAITAPTADAFYNLKKGFAEAMQNVLKGFDKLTDKIAYSLPKSKEELKELIAYATDAFYLNGVETQAIELVDTKSLEWAIAQLNKQLSTKKGLNSEEQTALMLMEAEIARRQRLEEAEAQEAIEAQKREEEEIERQKKLAEAEKKRLELAKLRAEWNGKTLQQEIDMLREEMNYKLDEVKDSESAEKEKFEIRAEYLNKILELMIKQKNLEKEAALEGITDAQTRGKITLYYENEIARLRKKNISDIGEYTEQTQKELKSLSDFITNSFDKIESTKLSLTESIEQATDKLEESFINSAGSIFSNLSEIISEGADAWEDFAEEARNAIKEVMNDLSAMFTKNAFLNLFSGNFATGGIQLFIGAVSALVGSFASMFSDFDSLKETVGNKLGVEIKNLSEAIEGWKDSTSGIGLSESLSGYVTDVQTLTSALSEAETELNKYKAAQATAQEKYESEWWFVSKLAYKYALSKISKDTAELQKAFDDLSKQLDNLAGKTLENLNSAIEETTGNIAVMMDLLAGQTDTKKELSISMQLNNITQQLYNFIDSVSTIGADIGSTLVSSITEGASKTDFLSDMKKYISSRLMQIAIYTESFQESLANVGAELAEALVTGGDLSSIRTGLEELFNAASESASKASELIESAFGDIQDSVTSLTSAMTSFWNSLDDLGGDIASELINGLTDGLEQGDFLETMQNYIKKMLVQTVVYTESMQAEIQAIGKAISKGLTEGFSDTSLHEIRRDLSYIFTQANSAIGSIDSLLDNVFSGYATGTNNATAGLHIVGEQGPELVRFKGGEQVYNAQKTAGMLQNKGGSTFNVTFNNTADTTAYAMMKQLKSYNRELAFNGII